MSLIDLRQWKVDPQARLFFTIAARKAQVEFDNLVGNSSTKLDSLAHIRSHFYRVGEYGFDQTLADLCAGAHGGSTLNPEVQAFLEYTFEDLLKRLKERNWLRTVHE